MIKPYDGLYQLPHSALTLTTPLLFTRLDESCTQNAPTVSPIKPYVEQLEEYALFTTNVLILMLSVCCREIAEKRFQDWPFAILFLLNVGIVFILTVTLGATAVKQNDELHDSLSDSTVKSLVGFASGVAVLAMALAVMMAKVISAHAHGMILFVLWCNVGVAIAVAALGVAIGNFFLVGVGALIVVLNWCYVRAVRHRIPLAVAHLRVAEAALAKHKAVYFTSMVFAIVQILWVVLWSLTMLGVASHISNANSGSTTSASGQSPAGKFGWAYALLLLSFYWGIQVFKNVVHTTVAGVVAAFWYSTESANTTTASLKRAMTTSFGSICFGSLLVAILQTLHALAKHSRKRGSAAACIAECILSLLESIMEYLNRWAYVYVGIYGYNFTRAGRAVSQLFHQRGFTALINDDLVRIVVRLAAIGVGLVCAGFGAVIAELSDALTFQASTTIVALLGFLVGFSVALTPLAVLSSSVATIFVCFAEDPIPLQRAHPELYNELAQGWHALHPDFMVQAGYWHV